MNAHRASTGAPARLVDLVNSHDRRLIAPLMGYPGIQLTKTSIKQNEFNWGVQFYTISELAMSFQPDAMFFMMDLAVEASALGLPVRFPLLESPTIEYHLVQEASDLDQFLACDILKDGRAAVFIETMKLMSSYLAPVPGAYCTGPFTLAGLMMGANDIAIKTVLDGELVHKTLEMAVAVIIRYARALALAGARIVAILEPTAVMLSPDAFWEFSGQYVKRILDALPGTMGVLHICGHSTHLLDKMTATGAQGLSLDSVVDFPAVAGRVSEDVVLIGNVDPVSVMRDGSVEHVREKVRELCDGMKPFRNFILSTGCDLPPDTPPANISAFMKAGRDFGGL